MSAHPFSDSRYKAMPYRRCGRSGLKLPAISLGLFQSLGDAGNEKLCRDVCFHAFDHGITHFDLANNYGTPRGHSEEVFGRIVREMPRDELVISTKAGFEMWPGPYGNWGSRKYLIASLDQSLRRLGLDYVDIFYHHRQDPDTPVQETLGALDQIVRSGKALYVGLSNYKGSQFADAVQMIDQRELAAVTIHQAKYNMFRRDCEADLFSRAEQAGTGVIAYSVLEKGVLSNRYLGGIPSGSRLEKLGERGRQQYEQIKDTGMLAKVGQLDELARARNLTLPQLAVLWALRDPHVTSVLVGVSSRDQLDEHIQATQAPPLTSEELRQIDTIVSG